MKKFDSVRVRAAPAFGWGDGEKAFLQIALVDGESGHAAAESRRFLRPDGK